MSQIYKSHADVQSRLKMHRPSIFEIPSHRLIPAGSSTITSFAYQPHEDEHRRRPRKVRYANTFRMDPHVKYMPEKVNGIIKEVLETNLTGKTYEPVTCALLCKTMAQDIKVRVKELDFKRYKIISTVTCGEKKEQGVHMGSRCLWDFDRDNYSTASFENAHLYAIGIVYAVYYE